MPDSLEIVMAGLDPAILGGSRLITCREDARVKPGHDVIV
jgi:hypothetical protein